MTTLAIFVLTCAGTSHLYPKDGQSPWGRSWKGLLFETPIHLMHSITTSIDSNERDPSLLIQIIDQEKEKYILYNPLKSIESYIISPIMTHFGFLQRRDTWEVLSSRNQRFLMSRKSLLTRRWPRSTVMVRQSSRKFVRNVTSSSRMQCLFFHNLFVQGSTGDEKPGGRCNADLFITHWRTCRSKQSMFTLYMEVHGVHCKKTTMFHQSVKKSRNYEWLWLCLTVLVQVTLL